MNTKKLTRADKERIRNSRCGRCRRKPPFPDGQRCHPHRLVPAKGYVKGNVVSLCPYCHGDEHPERQQFIRAATSGGRNQPRAAKVRGGLRMAQLVREDVMYALITKEARRKGGRLGAAAVKRRHKLQGLTAKELARNRANASKAGRRGAAAIAKNLTAAEYSAMRRRGWITRRRNAK